MRLPAINLSRREKFSLEAGAIVLVIFCGLLWGLFPLLDRSERLGRTIAAKSAVFAELDGLKAEVQALNLQVEASQAQLAKRDPQFTLFSYLDQLAGRTGIKDKIAYMKPSTGTAKEGGQKIAVVELKIQALTLAQLVDYLHQIETSANMIHVQWLAITKAGKADGFIDAVLQAETIEKG
jgi:general secretion pathway protein M